MGLLDFISGRKRASVSPKVIRTVEPPPVAARQNPQTPTGRETVPAPQTSSTLQTSNELLQNVLALGDSTKRDRALLALKTQPADNVLGIIKDKLLNSPDKFQRSDGTNALGNIGRTFGWPGSVELLESCLEDPEAYVTGGAIWGLNWASYNESLKPNVIDCVSRRLERLASIYSQTTDLNFLLPLSDLLPMAGPKCVPYMRQMLPNLRDKYQIEHATTILETFKASPTLEKPAIMRSLASDDVGERKKACYNSVDIGDSDVVDALIAVLQDYPDPQYNKREDLFQSTRKAAAYALGKIGNPKSVDVLLKESHNDCCWEVTNSGLVRRPDVTNTAELGMRAFGTSVREGLDEAGTTFARDILQKGQ